MSNIVSISDTEFIVASTQNDMRCIYKFNTTENKWHKYIKYPHYLKLSAITIAVNRNTKQLYMYTGDYYKIIKCNLVTKQFTIVETHNISLSSYPLSLIANNKYHIYIPQVNSIKYRNETRVNYIHYIYDEDIECARIVHKFPWESTHFLRGACIYVPSKNAIFLFRNTNLYTFSIHTQIWNKLSLYGYPYTHVKVSHFYGCILTFDERYILLFGYYIVLIFDVNTMEIRKNNAFVPTIACGCYAVNSNVWTNLLFKGYVKTCLKKENNMFVPIEIIEMVIKWYGRTDVIHLIRSSTGEHWKINVEDILQSANVNV
eukprot:391651_1